MVDQLTKNQRKGLRCENEARRILSRNYRLASRVTDTASKEGTTDLFNCADLIAVRPGWPTKFVQVKSNRGPASSHPSWVRYFVDEEFTQFEWWNRIDRVGWEIHAYEPDPGLVPVLELPIDETEAVLEYREYLEQDCGLLREL